MNPRQMWRFCSHLVENFFCLLDCVFESEFNSNQPIRALNERNKLRPNFQTLPFAFGQRAFCPCWTSLQGHLYRMNWCARRWCCVLDKKSCKKRNFGWTIIKARYSASNNKTVMQKLLSFLVEDLVLFSFSWLPYFKGLHAYYFSSIELNFRIFHSLGLLFLFMYYATL